MDSDISFNNTNSSISSTMEERVQIHSKLYSCVTDSKCSYKEKEDKMFTRAQIDEFIMNASDDYLATRVAMIIVLSGCSSLSHLHNIKLNNILDLGLTIEISFPDQKCTIVKKYMPVFRKYDLSRPEEITSTSFFYQIDNSLDLPKGTDIFVSMKKMPSIIAEYLNLPFAEGYTANSLPFFKEDLTNQEKEHQINDKIIKSKENKEYGEALALKLRQLPLDVACIIKNQIQHLLDKVYKTHINKMSSKKKDTESGTSDFSNLFEQIKRARSKDVVSDNEEIPVKKGCMEIVDTPSMIYTVQQNVTKNISDMIVIDDSSSEMDVPYVKSEPNSEIIVFEEIVEEDKDINETTTNNCSATEICDQKLDIQPLSIASEEHDISQIKQEFDDSALLNEIDS